MPLIERFGCNQCEFQFPTGWGGYLYATDAHGARIVCPHPGEFEAAEEITGMSYEDAGSAGRVGAARHAVCLRCLQQFDIDLEKDARSCPACKSPEIRTAADAVGQPCPACKLGTVERGSPQPPLDADWEQLPVPRIVKDLVSFDNSRETPESLKVGYELAESVSEGSFTAIAALLLSWWEELLWLESRSDEPDESIPMRPEWRWSQALPGVLAATPELARLVVVEKARCRFAPDLSEDVRRGMKNYCRKHRDHRIQC
jgi:hypothetical protein